MATIGQGAEDRLLERGQGAEDRLLETGRRDALALEALKGLFSHPRARWQASLPKPS
jgi:hypothetical protein